MSRSPDSQLARRAYEIIRSNPGIKRQDLRRQLGLSDGYNMEALLASCENNCLLISEDSKRLYPWSMKDVEA